MTETIVAFLRANAEQLDVDMAEALNIPLDELRQEIARLAASGDVICCRVTRFIDGRKIEGISCRLWYYPQLDVDVIILGNQSSCAAKIAWDIHDLLYSS